MVRVHNTCKWLQFLPNIALKQSVYLYTDPNYRGHLSSDSVVGWPRVMVGEKTKEPKTLDSPSLSKTLIHILSQTI
jgi:hypothetical protein